MAGRWSSEYPGYTGARHTAGAIARLPVTLDDAEGMSWDDFPWPGWVPHEMRARIGHTHRTVSQYLGDYASSNAPAMGTLVRVYPRSGPERVCAMGVTISLGRVGRWVYAWGNMGRVVFDDGDIAYPSLRGIEASEPTDGEAGT